MFLRKMSCKERGKERKEKMCFEVPIRSTEYSKRKMTRTGDKAEREKTLVKQCSGN